MREQASALRDWQVIFENEHAAALPLCWKLT